MTEYEKMTKKQLAAFAAKKGIKVNEKDLKAVMIAHIKKALEKSPVKQNTTTPANNINDDVLRHISKFANAETRQVLKRTTKLFKDEVKDEAVNGGKKNAEVILSIIKDMMYGDLDGYDKIQLSNGKKTITISWNERFGNAPQNNLVIFDGVTGIADVPKMLLNLPTAGLKKDDLTWSLIGSKMKYKKTFEGVMNNLSKLTLRSRSRGWYTAFIDDWKAFVTKNQGKYLKMKKSLRINTLS